MSLEERLGRIRSSPKLQNQQHTAVILQSIDDTLKAQATETSPTAYFAALLSLLGQYISPDGAIQNKDLATAVVYLLDLVTPHLPPALVRAKLSQILAGVATALIHPDADAPLVRGAIGCLESILVIQDAQSWAMTSATVSPRRAVAGLLHLSIDPRPKVRKRSLDALVKILQSPPPSPSLDHPASDQCAEAALHILQDEAQKAAKARKSKGNKDAGHDPQLIHALQLIKAIAGANNGWPSRKIDALCETLLTISKSSHEYLVMAAFDVFEVIFEGLAGEVSSAKLPRLLEVIMELQPSKDDSQLLPPWIAILSRGYDVAAQIEPEDTFDKLPALFESIAKFLSSSSHNVRVSASECLISLLHTCVPQSVVLEPSIMDEKTLERIAKVIDQILTVRFQAAWMEVFHVVAAAFESFKWRSNPALRSALSTIGELRSNGAFAGKKEADAVIASAIKAAGPDFVLEVLPLNLAQPKAGQPGRAWLLPLMRTSVRNTRLAHFRSELVPLSEVMFQKVLNFDSAEKTMEIKIFETVVQQVWDTLPGYCDLPLDLTEAFDQSFAELLANLLYQQPQLRTDLCRALQNLVISNQAVTQREAEEDLVVQGRITKDQAVKNLAYLSAFASNLLAVLFNVYGETLPQYRGLILQCIDSYLSIIPEAELIETVTRVSAMLEAALQEEGSQTQADKQKTPSKGPKMPPTSHTLMDLIITMSVHLPRTTFPSLFTMAANVVSKDNDPQLQKKAYKLIPRLAESETGRAAILERNADLQQLLLTTGDKATAPAKRDRLDAIACVVPSLPSTDLHFIPAILSEVIIGLKEVNEKARGAAFDLLILMGEKLSEGGTVVNSRVPHMQSDAPDAQASLDEYLTMVTAGLAGATPHMVSACITALARLLYEFRERLEPAVVVDLVSTVDLFLTSNNREIVRSCLGFVKVCVLSLPAETMRPRLETLIPNLMVWSREHKAHFKAKVKHILERMIKRFGVDEIERWTPVEDRKLIANIRKMRDRAKRKRDAAKDGDAEEGGADDEDAMDVDGDGNNRRGRFESGLDEALYASDDSAGSGSDISDDEVLGRSVAKGKARAAAAAASQRPSKPARSGEGSKGTFIVEDDDEPLDLLDRRALANVSTTRPTNARDPSRKRKSAPRNEDGKLIFNDDNGGDGGDEDVLAAADRTAAGAADLAGGIDAYVAAIRGVSAPRRGQRGKLKFGSAGKQQQRGKGFNEDGEDDREGGDQDGGVEVAAEEVRGALRAAHTSSRGRGGRGAGAGDRGRGRGRGGARGRGGYGGGERRGLGVDKRRSEQGGGGGGGGAGRGRGAVHKAGRASTKFRPKHGGGGGRR